MKKTTLFLFTLFLSGLMLGVNGQIQDTIKGLIFSEHRAGDPHAHYLELCNMGTETVDLSKVTIANVIGNTLSKDENDQWRLLTAPAATRQIRISGGELAPGETWMIMGVSDRFAPGQDYPDHRTDMLPLADEFCMTGNAFGVTDTIIPEWQMWGDSVSTWGSLLWNWGDQPFVLFNHLENGDSIMIDQVGLYLTEANVARGPYLEVAGIAEAGRYYTLVRKANITQGNMVWNSSKGATLEDSEWIPIPNQYGRMSYTTIKNHGDFQVDVQSSTVDVDKDNSKMTVPWGIYKGDSIIANHLDLGLGMAWQYVQNGNLADSAHTIMQNRDTLILYAAGNELDQVNFEIVVLEPAADQAVVFPTSYVVRGGAYWINPNNQQYEWNEDDSWVTPYYVTIGQGVDTVGNVPYATRVDSLFRYLEKAPNAKWEIVWKDGEVHADLRNGDILKVTSEDESTVKEYYIDVLDYAASDNALLGAITWPDKQEFLENWKGDTIPSFSSAKTSYTILVPYGSVNVPVLVAHPVDINATLEVQRAVSLTGSQASRTTSFKVIAQSDTIEEIYSVTFELEKDPTKVQIWEDATPFFSEHATLQRSTMFYLEICNPGNTEMDLSEYMVMKSTAVNPGDAVSGILPAAPTEVDFKNRYRSYVPGYSYFEDTINWVLNPGILSLDANVDAVVEPGGVFVISASAANRIIYYTDYHLEDIDRIWYHGTGSLTENGVHAFETPSATRGSVANAIYLFKIVGDSILDGLKPVGDPADYELVDVIGDPIADGIWNIAGRSAYNQRGRMRTKTDVYTGARSLVESSERFGTAPDTSAWIVETYNKELPSQDDIPDFIGSHVMDAVTIYLSTVTSSVYLVSDGFAEGQTIQGDLTSTTVEGFFGNVDKADPMQILSVHSGVDGSVKDPATAAAGGDTLVVVSADGKNMTAYALVDIPLDSDAVLTTVDDPSDLTITYDGAEGMITGVVYGSLLKDLVAAVAVPDLAVMNVINGAGELIPSSYMNYDSVKVDTKVGADVYFEVVAQDLVTVITYKLEPSSLASDAFVISSIYEVDEEGDDISNLADGTIVDLFFNNIEVVKGASAVILSKLGHERLDGTLSYDDVLKVVSEDGTNTVVYFLTFLGESNPDANTAPEIELAFSDTTFAEPGTIMLMAKATDDGLPPPAALTSLWEVTSANAADAVIETADQLSTNVAFNAKGSYTVTLSVSDGALTTKSDVSVFVGGVGIDQNLVPAMYIYPNPAKDKLTLELMNMPGSTSIVSIYSITGSTVFNTKLSTDKLELDLSSFESGLYFIKVNSKDQTFTTRVQIQK